MYSHGSGLNMLDKGSCREWAARIKALPEGFTVYKNNLHEVLGVPSGVYASTLTTQEIRNCRIGYGNAREAVGDDIDIAVHAHGELDAPSAIKVAQAVEPMNPLWFEDPLNPVFHEGWMDLRRSTTIRLLTGEKLELVRQFKPFLDNGAIDVPHPDLCFSGGITGVKQHCGLCCADADAGGVAQCWVAGDDVCECTFCVFDSEPVHGGERAGASCHYVEAMAASNGAPAGA